MRRGRVQNIGEIHREPYLAANPWARDVFASEHTEIQSHAVTNRVLAPYQSLQLASAQVPITRETAVHLAAQS